MGIARSFLKLASVNACSNISMVSFMITDLAIANYPSLLSSPFEYNIVASCNFFLRNVQASMSPRTRLKCRQRATPLKTPKERQRPLLVISC